MHLAVSNSGEDTVPVFIKVSDDHAAEHLVKQPGDLKTHDPHIIESDSDRGVYEHMRMGV